LSEGGFFARADVAAYQVELNGDDVMQYVPEPHSQTSFLEGTYVEGDSEMILRVQKSAHYTALYLENTTDGSAKLMTTNNGTFLFQGGALSTCMADTPKQKKMLHLLDVDELKSGSTIPFASVSVTHGRESKDGFIPNADLSSDDCLKFQISKTNFSDPHVSKDLFGSGGARGNDARKLFKRQRESMTPKVKRQMHHAEMLALMGDANNVRNKEIEHHRALKEIAKKEIENRKLVGGGGDYMAIDSDASMENSTYLHYSDIDTYMTSYKTKFDYTPYAMTFGGVDAAMGTYVTHFDLWIATRLADPTFINQYYEMLDEELGAISILAIGTMDSDATMSGASYMSPSTVLSLSGTKGISVGFKVWSGMSPVFHAYIPDLTMTAVSMFTDSSTVAYDETSTDPTTGFSWVPATGMLVTESEAAEMYYTMSQSGYTPKSTDKIPLTSKQFSERFSSLMLHAMYPGTCSGGYAQDWEIDLAGLAELGYAAMEDTTGWWTEWVGLTSGFDVGNVYYWCEAVVSDFSDNVPSNLVSADSNGYARTMFAEFCEIAMTSFVPGYEVDSATSVMDPLELSLASDMNGGKVSLIFPNAWGSLLSKSVATDSKGDPFVEYIVAFQGTKATDLSMLQYNTRQSPVFTFIGDDPIIVPEGYYDYMSGMLPCFDYMTDTGNGVIDKVPTFITGHSLGGAAATLYAGSKTWSDSKLVTFGAAPTYFVGTGPNSDAYVKTKIKCKVPVGMAPGDIEEWCGFGTTKMEDVYASFADSRRKLTGEHRELAPMGYFDESKFESEGFDVDDLEMLPSGWTSFKSGVNGSPCDAASTESVRFYHKFDPVPSVAMWKGQYAHSVEWAIMVMDKFSTSCGGSNAAHDNCAVSTASFKSAGSYDIMDMGMGGSNPLAVTDYLCTKNDISTATWPSTCKGGYSSYMTMLNPFPCGQILFMEKWGEFIDGSILGFDTKKFLDGEAYSVNDLTTATFGGDNGEFCLWNFDGAPFCMNFYDLAYSLFKESETFSTCVADWMATVDAYILSSVVDMWYQFGMLFTFSAVHSSYPYYPLCVGSFVGGSPSALVSGNTPEKFGWASLDFTAYAAKDAVAASCGSSSVEAIMDGFCSRRGYKETGACYLCMEAHCDTLATTFPTDCCNAEFEEDIGDDDMSSVCANVANYGEFSYAGSGSGGGGYGYGGV
jgi:hypothetical protein